MGRESMSRQREQEFPCSLCTRNLLQPGVLLFRLSEDLDIGVSIFPWG
jgi:hypothetical protein